MRKQKDLKEGLTEIKKKGTLKGRKDKQDSHSLKGKATKGKQKIGKQSSSEESAGKIKGKGKQSKGGKQKKDELEHGDIHHPEVAEESKYLKKVIDYSPKDDSQRIKGSTNVEFSQEVLMMKENTLQVLKKIKNLEL